MHIFPQTPNCSKFSPIHCLAALSVAIYLITLHTACGGIKETARNKQPTIDDYNFAVHYDIDNNKATDSVSYEELPAIEVLPTIYQPALTQTHDIKHTKLDLRFDWQKKHLIGKAILTLQPHFYTSDKVNIDAKGFDIHSIALLSKDKANMPLKYNYNDSLVLEINLDRPYKRDETYQIAISYTAQPERLIKHHTGRFHYDNKGLYFIMPDSLNPNKPYQIWTQGETYGASCWFPTIDAPNQKTSEEITITVENKYQTLSNGKLISSTNNPDGTRSDYWKQELPHSPYLFVVAIGEYAVYKDKWRDKEVNYYVEPKYAASAKAIFGNTPDMLTFFSERLGVDFPWDKYSQAVVRDFVAGAMENTSATLFYEQLQRDERELLEGNDDDIIAHELFHHWFGDLVTCESWANLALNESFATYGEYLWIDHKYGRDAADAHLSQDLRAYLNEAEEKKEPIIRYYYSNADDDLFDAHSYQKGGRVLHMLRNHVGDDAFFTAVTQYLKAHAFKTAEVNDLRMTFESVTGEDLNWFFDQWMLTKGHPELDIAYSVDTANLRATVIVQQTQAQDKVFILPTQVEIVYPDGSKERQNIRISKRNQTFTLPIKKTPKLLNFDPEKILLCTRTEHKGTQGYIDQYYHYNNYNDRWEALQALGKLNDTDNNDLQKLLLHAATNDPYYALRKEAIDILDSQTIASEKTLQTQIIAIARTDAHPLVREAALARLDKSNTPEVIAAFAHAMRDSSYQVIYTALQGLFTLAPEKAVYYAQMSENTDNPTLINAIAHIYSQAGTSKNQAFFEQHLPKTYTYNRYAMIEFYSKFLQRCNDNETTFNSLKTLQSIAQNDSNWWIRLRAAEAIRDMRTQYVARQLSESRATAAIHNTTNTPKMSAEEQLDFIDKAIDTLKKRETNQQVLSIYNSFN
jgi:aminopeptidase N